MSVSVVPTPDPPPRTCMTDRSSSLRFFTSLKSPEGSFPRMKGMPKRSRKRFQSRKPAFL